MPTIRSPYLHSIVPSAHLILLSHNVHFRQSHSITRAFLIEEATIVKRVLKAKAAGPKK